MLLSAARQSVVVLGPRTLRPRLTTGLPFRGSPRSFPGTAPGGHVKKVGHAPGVVKMLGGNRNGTGWRLGVRRLIAAFRGAPKSGDQSPHSKTPWLSPPAGAAPAG